MNRVAGTGKVVALCGGVGGAKLVLGLDRILPAGNLSVIVNTADDFEHLGLRISPDIDTVAYTLADLANPETGWGRRDETWSFMETLADLNGETWFQLGDRDLALHVERTRMLGQGQTLTEVTSRLCKRLGLTSHLLPMTDNMVSTIVDTDQGSLEFQRYFVAQRAEPVVRKIRFAGADKAIPTPAVINALSAPDLTCVVLAPSNPYLSLDPVLAIEGLRDALAACGAPIIAVSPIVGAAAVKGPTAKIMRELGIPVTSVAVAQHYDDLIDGIVIDRCDAKAADEIDVPVRVEETLMTSLETKTALAQAVLAFAEQLSPGASRRGAA